MNINENCEVNLVNLPEKSFSSHGSQPGIFKDFRFGRKMFPLHPYMRCEESIYDNSTKQNSRI